MVFIFILLIIIFLLIMLSKIRIEVSDFQFSYKSKEHIKFNCFIKIKLLILKKVPIFKITITNEKFKKWNINKKMNKTKIINKFKEHPKLSKKDFEKLKRLMFEVQKIRLKMDIGTENAVTTAMIVPFVSMLIIFIFQKIKIDFKNQSFQINPIFINQNAINIQLKGIFEIKMIHIIFIIYILNKKKGGKRNERTSNRGAYDYSYE